ncbi:uncharacterized protein LOC125237546 isoform X2 [Leguminivora glycinivorella]|uniref:uncharacterized protein LOC125237546 isoform X2 n=1 Tax=Leguminivora glycinivorella TaxID=1035111 RepID=UPI00200CF918|nr:uncharacterized protein LOC125237546 isoform X2 [Leguminivora glycinivorella]
MPVESNISLETALRISDAISDTPEPQNLDFNMNQNCERKVLSQVQENNANDVDKECHKSRISNDDVPLRTEQDKERMKLKRQSLLNRKISHFGGLPPIVLTYAPLSKKATVGNILHPKSPKNGIAVPNPTLKPSPKNGIVAATAGVPATEGNNGSNLSTVQASDAKENKQSIRRISLRSSNKITNKIAAPVKQSQTPLKKKIVKLQVTDNVIKHGNTTITKIKNKDCIKIAKRTSNRKLNNNKANKSQPMSPVKIQQNVAESNELIDFEEELNSSKILKTSIATIETHDLENTSTQELGTNTLVIEKGKQSERCIFNKIEEKEMTKTSDAVGVFVDEGNKLKPTAIEENTKQVSVMKNEHETASVASSPLLDETNKIKSTIVDDERDVKQKLAVNLPLVDQKEVKNSETAETSVQSCGTDSIDVNKDDIKSDKSQIVPNKVIESDQSDATAALHSNRKIIVLKEGTTIQENTENKITIETGAKKPVQIASLECPEENVNPVSEVEDDIVEIIETSSAAANTQTKIVHSNNLPDKTSIKEQQETIDTSKSISSKEIVNDVHNDKSIHQKITTEKVDLPKLLDRQLSNQKQTNTKPEMQNKSLEGDEKPQVQTTTNALTNSSSHTDVTDTKNKENSKTYMKGDIKIKEITLDDPTKTAVRIFLPNGKVFKATISGKVHGDLDSLFAEPSMRAILSSSLNNDGSRYTINYKQVQVKTNPSKPIYKIHDLQIKGTHSAPIDTVNLISDDEDDVPTRSFNTEFGKYVTNHDQETIDIHQKKFDQRCEVKMLKGDLFKSNRTKSKSKSMPSEKNSLLTRHQSKLLSVVTSTITKEETDSNSDTLSQAQTSPTPPLLEQSEPPTVSETPDVIELDDSSNDSFENQSLDTNAVSNKNIEPVKVNALANLLLQDLGLEQDEVVKLPSPVKSGAAVVNLKSALLQDLGIAPTVTPVIDITENDDDDEVLLLTDVQKANTNHDEKNSHVTTEENKTRNVEQSNLKKCVVKLMKCETLIKKYELMRKMKNCYVKMERLENMLLPSASVCKLSDRQTDEMNQNMAEDFIAFDVDEPCSTPQLSRCPSLSILNNWDDDSQPSLENPYCTSPVMEIYDMLVQLRNKLKTNLLRESIELLPMTCDSEWNMTKFQCSTQQIILSSSNIPVTENQILLPTCDRTVTAEKLMTFETPKLLTITLKFLEDTPNLLCCWESARRRELISKDKSSPNKLKRKAEEVVSDVVASKVLKLKILALKTLNSHIKTPSILIEDQHMALQPDIFEASCKYNTVTIGNLEDGKQAKVQSLKNRVQTKVIVDSVMSPTDIETQTIFKKENHHPSNILDNIETLHKQSDTVIIDGVTSHFREVNSHVACRTSGFDTFDNDFLVDDREVTSPSLLCDYTENFVKENENNKNLLDEDDIQELTSSSSLSGITGGCDKEKQINADADSEQTSNNLPTHAKSDNSSSCVTIAGDNDQLNHPSYSKNIETSDEKKDILEVTLPSPTDNNEVDKEHNEHSKDVEHFVASSKETQGLDRNITEDKHRTISPRPREDNSEDGNQNEGNTFTDSIKEKQDVTSSSFTDNNEFDKENDTGISINKEKTENYVSQSKEVELSTSSSEIDCLDRDTKEKEHMSAFLHKDGPEECKEKLMDTSVIDIEVNKEVVSLLADYDKSGKEKDDNNEEAVKDVSQSELEYSVASSTVTDNLGKDVTEANQQSTYPLPRNDDSEDGKEKQIDINPINEETTNKILQLQDVESFDLNDAENHQKEFSPSPLSNISQISDKDEGNLSPLKEIESSTSLTNKNDFDQDITDNNLVDLSPPPLSDNTETDDEKNEMCLINSERFSKASENPIANSQHETDYSNNDNIQDIPVVTASPPLNERIITDPGEAATDKDATEDRKSLKSPISRKEHIETIENQLSEIAGGQDLTTDTLHVEEIEDSVGLDEDSVDEITTEVCEVVVIATDVYDDDIAETLINTSKEMNLMVKDVSGINRDSELKSPDFIDNKTIAFNYHDYTKRSKNKQDITTGTSICNHISDPTRDNVSVSDLKTESITLNERYIHHEPSSEIPTIRDCYHKSKPELKYELIQEDDFLTVKITTENDEDNKTKAIISPKDIEEDTVVASPCSNNTDDMNLKGFELEDVYIFPLSQAGSNNSNLSSDSIVQELHSESVTGNLPDDLHDIEFHVKEPEMTYSRKRKMDMRDVKIAEKKYRKGKNIDCSKQTQISMIELAYSKEYKRLLEYCSSVKFSYTRPFHKECIEIENLMVNWPINSVCHDVTPADVADERLFVDLEVYDSYQPDPATQTFVEEISYEYNRNDAAREGPTIEASETNFNMGFGEGSGRVIQILNTQSKSNISAATLPDVKQSQPVFKSVNSDDCNDVTTNNDDQIKKIRQHVNFIELRDKVRQFFKKSIVELKSDWVHQNTKDELHPEDFPFGLCSLDYVKPVPTNVIVQVVQVGQLPVSAAAQNPVTCDPRVTQVSDASPSQCSVDNSPNDDSQSEIKTEYTELTTADLSLPLQQYAQQNQANLASQDNNVELIEQTISLEMEIKAEESPEIKQELPDIKEEKSNSSDTELHTLNNATPENMDYSFENNTAKSDASNVNYDSSEKKSSETFSQQRQQNGNSEKTDQIAHAMSAAGITTTPETVTNTRAHALVNILSQKIRQGSVNTTQTTTNTYSKTSINAMALQQALAQILPPPLNQTGSSENNQTQSTPVGPQVLHIVQGKNSSGNQITLVDNSQQSVISTPNATQVLHIVQNKNATSGQASNGTLTPQANSFSGLSLVDAGLQQGGNQLLHIVNTGNQKTASPGQLLKRVNLLTNLTNVQGSNEQKMVQFVCKSADGKAIQLNAPHQRSMVLRLQPIETPNVQTPPAKSAESQELNSSPTATTANKESASQQEIKSRSIYEENYAKFIQNSSSKTPGLEKSTSLPKFNQAFGKPVFQEGSQKQGETATNNSHLPSVNNNSENAECPPNDNAINLEHMGNISSPPLLIRKPVVTTQSQSNIVQQIKQTIAPMNIQTMHGGVIYTRQIPVNIGGGQTINLITVPSTELINDDSSKTQSQNNQGDIEPSIIKIVPQSQTSTNNDSSQEENNSHASGSNENPQTPQPQPVLTQMRIKLPMLSKAPQMVPGARVVRPSFFQIQRNVIGGANQPVYQQLVLTAAPPLGQQTIRLPSQASRPVKVPSENQSSSSESQMSSSTLEQLREFDMVLEQVKERSTSTPSGNSNNSSFKIHASSDTTDGNASSNCSTESTSQVLYSIGNNQALNVAYVNRKSTVTTPTTSTYVRSPDSSGIADSPTSSTHVQIAHTVTTDSSPTEMSSQSKPAKVGGSSKSKSRPKSTSNPPNTLKLSSSVPPKTSSQKPLEDEQTTQRILYILAEYKEQVENSPDKDKPAPRRRSNPPSNPGSSKRKKSSSSRRSGTRDMSPVHGEDTCRTMGSEDSSCGTSQGDCTESCLDSHSPQDSPRKVARKITFDQELNVTQPRPQPQRNVIVADGQTITVARGTTGKPATAVLMPANYILPVSMVKGGQQIAIVTNRGPKLLTVGGEGGATNALLLQRLIGPAGLKPVLARPGVRHVRLPTAALHNLQAFNLAPATTVQPPDSTASPTPGPTPPELVDTRATSSPWTDRDEVKPERSSSPEGSEPWNLPSTDAHDYSYEETVRTDNMDRTVLVVQKKDGSQRQHRLAHVSAAALRHKYAILEHELRLQKSLSEECEDLGVDSPSASELFPEAELLFANSPAHEHNQEHHSHTPQPHQSSIPQPDMDDQIATDHLIPREIDVSLGLGDVGIVAVSEDGSATIALDQEEFARSHPNTTFHSEPTEGEVQPFTITGLKGRHITSTIFHSNSAPATVLMTAPQATVISQAPDHSVKYEIENMINMPGSHNNDINLSSVLVKDDGLTRFDSILTDSRELHLTNTASAIVHSSGNATQVIRRVCYEDDKRERDARYLIDEPDNLIAGDDAKMIAEDSSRDATLESMADVDDDRSSPERHAELFWESNSASERSESRRPLDFSSDSDKCCKSPSFDETNSTDSSGVGTHMRLDSVIKEARTRERSGSADGSSADDTHPPLRTYPPKRAYHPLEGEAERSLSGKTLAGERSPDLEVRRRASGRGVVKRGCHCCNGSPAPPRPKKPRQRKPTLDFNTDN